MQRHSKRKKWTVAVEAWGAVRARKVAKAVERERVLWLQVRTQVQPWDLLRVQAQAEAVALALAQAQAQTEVAAAKVRVLAEEDSRMWMWMMMAMRAGAESVKRQQLAKSVRCELLVAKAKAIAEVHKAMRVWMQQVPGRVQVHAWLRVCEAHQVEGWAREDNSDLDRTLWPRSRQDYWWLIQIITPITRLPPELLQQIFLIIIDNANDSPLILMRVCKYWHNVVTGIWALLKLGRTTPKDAVTARLERNQWLLDVLVDTETDRGPLSWYSDPWNVDQSIFYKPFNWESFRAHFVPPGDAYQAIFVAMQATSRWRSLVVRTFPAQADLPEDLVNRGLQQCTGLAMSRLRTLIIKCPCEISPLLDCLLRILGNTASGELMTVTINSPTVISFLVSTYSSIFRSVTVLSLDAPGLPNPVDILPHLHQLEVLTASHLPLPIYHDDVDLPFVHTLRQLTLRSVSIQWMSGRTFHVLESCTIVFPLHRHVLHAFCTTLPNCKHLSFEGYPLNILNGASAHRLAHLSVTCSSYKPRGNQELALFSSQALQEGRLAPRILHITVEATNGAWTKALAFMSTLEELVIYNARPSSLGAKALQSLVIFPVHANTTDTAAASGEWNTPACPSLKRFGLQYHRWLRPSEHFDLIPVFMSIIRSRQQSMFTMQSFLISITSDQDHSLELIEGPSVSSEGFGYLKRYATIPLVDNMF
jgi:hypothetical protein